MTNIKKKGAAYNSDDYFTRNKWIYSIGGIGRDMSYALFTQFLLTYILFTRTVSDGEFAAIGIIMAICRVWDGLNDPVMGGIVENTRTRFGKFKPWIMIGCIANGAAVVAMFSNRVEGRQFVYLFIFLYLVWDITYTMNDIGYWSMLPSLTSQATKRDKITALATLFSGLGSLATTGLASFFTAGEHAVGGNSISAYRAVSAFVVIMFIGCQSLCCAGVRENRSFKAEKEERIGLKKMFSVIVRNDQLLWATLVTLLASLSGAMLTAFGANYIYLQFGYNGLNVTLFTAFYAGAAGFLLIFFPKLSAKFKRKNALLISVIIAIIGYACFIIGGIFIPEAIKLQFLCGSALIVGFGQNWFSMVVMIIFTNTIEYNEYKTGSRDEALIFSLRPFMSKMSSALQQVIVTVVYLLIGMTTVTNQISDFENQANLKNITEAAKLAGIQNVLDATPASMAFKLAACMAIIPIILLAIGYFVMLKKNKVDEEAYEKMVTEIAARKENGESTEA